MNELSKPGIHVWPAELAKKWGLFLMRVVIGLFFGGAALFIFFSVPAENAWIPVNGYIDARVIGAAAFMTGVLILFGLFTYQSALAAGVLILVIVAEHLLKDPFYNFSAQMFPLLLFVAAVLYLCPDYNNVSLDRLIGFKREITRVNVNSWIVILLRVFLGLIFFTQGLINIIKVGVVNFAQKVYVTPFAESWLPSPLLWMAGLLNPPVQLVGGLALILGFRTKLASLGLAVFLVSIIFGHIIQSPFEDIHDFSIANFIVVLMILFLESEGNRYSLDYALEKRRN